MNIPCCRVAGIYVVHGGELRPVLNRFRDLLGRPSALGHLVLPLLRGMIAAELPARWAAWIHECVRLLELQSGNLRVFGNTAITLLILAVHLGLCKLFPAAAFRACPVVARRKMAL